METAIALLIAAAAAAAVIYPLVRPSKIPGGLHEPEPGGSVPPDATATPSPAVALVCGRCGNRNAAGSRFCAECGNELGTGELA